MKILFIHSLMFHHRTWTKAANRLADEGIILSFTDQMSAMDLLQPAHMPPFDLLIAELALGLPAYDRVLTAGRVIPLRLGLTAEMPGDFTTFKATAVKVFMEYLSHISEDNFHNAIRFIMTLAGRDITCSPPARVLATGIYHPAATRPFEDAELYRAWLRERREGHREGKPAWIGLLFFYSQLIEGNTADIDALISALEHHGLAPFCVFCRGVEDLGATEDSEPAWLTLFRQQPGVELILNCMAGRLLRSGEQQLSLLAELNVPIIQLLRVHNQTAAEWLTDPQGLPAMTTIYSLAQPETCGVIAPLIVAGAEGVPQGERGNHWRTFQPIDERIHTLCRRIHRRLRLRRMDNRDKNISIVLHNNPCKGLEATIGLAAGLDTFESLALLLQQMKAAGYDTGQAPVDGRTLLADIMDHKAISEFRWTTTDEILAKGGALATMGRCEYQEWFTALPEAARQKVLADWGDFPGQGMVVTNDTEQSLLITGRQYGKIRLMVQPKRGCYGAKCTGEVCRILHDPTLAPPHHWLATYKYIQDHSDAVIHFGSEGALEFLPGKQTALCNACFPEISIGDLPNFYVYIMDATGEGLLAKRRGQAVLVDHLTPVYRPTPMDPRTNHLEDLLRQFQQAEQVGETARKELLSGEIGPLLLELNLADTLPTAEEFPTIARLLRRRLALSRQTLIGQGLHLLGCRPDGNATGHLLATLLRTPPEGLPDTATIAGWFMNDKRDAHEITAEFLGGLAAGHPADKSLPPSIALQRFCRETAAQLERCSQEISHLLGGLDGGFVPPGLSGSLSRGRNDFLPTGRNFFATDITVLPTSTAWSIGQRLADKLLAKFLREEGRFPESIGISIWSTDAFKADGELLCQTLAMMGARPLWHSSGRVSGVEAMPLEELRLDLPDGSSILRPRVDVTIQTSGIMRDMVPNFCRLLDQAVTLLSFLEESDEENYLRKHTREQMERLRDQIDTSLGEAHLRRMATLRIFSSSPGTYGIGVGLALDASAWQNSEDLAEVYINWGGYAYGFDPANTIAYGLEARRLLADNLARIDVSYMKQCSAEYDLLDCSCHAVSQGGMTLAAAAVGKKQAKLYWGDATLPESADVRDLGEEIDRIARAKLLNQAWIDGMRKHGYKGAQEASNRINTLFKWSATTQLVPKELFDAVVTTYIAHGENHAWLRRDNPHALEEITRRLLEAASRGLWAADPEFLAVVQAAALEIEGDMEEGMGDIREEFQGGKVEVLTAADVDKWQPSWRLKEYRQ